MIDPKPIIETESSDTGGLKLWALLLHIAAIASGIAFGVASFDWLTR